MSPEEQYTAMNGAAESIRTTLAQSPLGEFVPKAMIICGSGLGGIVNILKDQVEISYGEIPGFQVSTVPGHEGRLVFGRIQNTPVMCMVGRLHFYEGYSLESVTFPVRVAAKLGCETVFVTNAAGGIREGFKPGDLMIIYDHFNFPGLAGNHPLRGPNLEEFGPRFLALSDAYDLELRKSFYTKAKELGVTRNIFEGTYCYVSGPTFESRAESRFIRALGFDAVGMSTVPEVIVARHSGMRVFALSLITNECVIAPPASALEENPVPLDHGKATHAEVLESANLASRDVQKIMEAVIADL